MSKVSPIRIPFRPDGKGFKADLIPQRGQALFAKNVAETMDLFRGQIQGFQSDLSKMVQKSSIDRSLQAIGNVLGTKVATFEDIYQGDWRKSPFKSLTRFDLSMFSLLENPEDAFRAIANRPHRFPVYVSWSLCPDSSNEEELRVSLLFSKRMSIEVGEPDDINGSRSFPLRKDVNSAFAKTRKRVAPLLAMNMNPAGDLLVPPKKESVAQGLVSEALNLENIILQGSKLEVLLDDCSERIWYANHNTYLSPQEVRVLLERVFMVKRWSKGDLVKGADRMATNLVARTKYLFVGFDQVVLYDGNRRSICEIKLDSEEKDRILGLVIKKPDRPRGEEAELREVMEADFSGRSADKYSNYVMRLLINDLHQRSEGEKKHKHFSVFDRLTEKISKEYGKEVVFRFSENQVFALPYTGEVKDPHQPEYLFVVERILSGLPKWLLNVLPQKVVVSGPLFNYATYDKRRGKETYEIVISQRQDVSFLHDGEIFIDSRHGSLEFPQEFIFALYRKENRTETLTHLSENLSEYYYRQIMTAAERRAYFNLVRGNHGLLSYELNMNLRSVGDIFHEDSRVPGQYRELMERNFEVGFGRFIQGQLPDDDPRHPFFKRIAERETVALKKKKILKQRAPKHTDDRRLTLFNTLEHLDPYDHLWHDPKTFQKIKVSPQAARYMVTKGLEALSKDQVDQRYAARVSQNLFELLKEFGGEEFAYFLTTYQAEFKKVLGNVSDLGLITILPSVLASVDDANIKAIFENEIIPIRALVFILKQNPEYRSYLSDQSFCLRTLELTPDVNLDGFNLQLPIKTEVSERPLVEEEIPSYETEEESLFRQAYQELGEIHTLDSKAQQNKIYSKLWRGLEGARDQIIARINQWQNSLTATLDRIESDQIVASIILNNNWFFYFRRGGSFFRSVRSENLKRIIFELAPDQYLKYYTSLGFPYLADLSVSDAVSWQFALAERGIDVEKSVRKYLLLKSGAVNVQAAFIKRWNKSKGTRFLEILRKAGYLDQDFSVLPTFANVGDTESCYSLAADLSTDDRKEIGALIKGEIGREDIRHFDDDEYAREIKKRKRAALKRDYLENGSRTVERLSLNFDREVEALAISEFLGQSLDESIPSVSHPVACSILGIDSLTPIPLAKKVYIELARLFHPDSSQDDDNLVLYKKIEKAWQTFRKTRIKFST